MSACPLCLRDLPENYSATLCPLCAMSRASGPTLECIGAYEIIEPLGHGGMGTVYLASHVSSGRIVALKVPGADPEILRRFQIETEAVAALDHPHILPIYEVGDHEGLPFYTMKFAEGGNLAERLSEFRQPERAARLVADVAEAVAHAHARGILHRDLKPQNILLDAHGEVFVSDFGLARWLHRPSEVTQSLQMLGTPSYLAPELLSGDTPPTTAADIFGLGAILYHLLAGHPPFQRASLSATLKSVAEETPSPLRSVIPGLSRDLATICEKCLEHDPAHRYSLASQLASDLRHWLAGEVISIRRLGTPERLARWCRRNPRLTAAASIAALGVFGGGAAALVSTRLALQAETARADAAEQLSRTLRQSSLVEDSKKMIASGRAGQRLRAIPRLQEAWRIQPSLEIRNAAIAALSLPDVTKATPLPITSVCPGTKVAFCISAACFATIPAPDHLVISSLRDSRSLISLRLRKSDFLRGLVAFDETGRLLAVRMASGHIRIWNLDTKTALTEIKVRDVATRAGWEVFAFLPKHRAAYVDPDGQLEIVSLDGGTRTTLHGSSSPDAVMASPDGRWLAAIFARQSRIEIHNLQDGKIRYATFPKPIDASAWSPEGHSLVVACLDKHLYVWDRETSGISRRASTRESPSLQILFSSSGLAATTARDHTLRLWDPDYPDDRLAETEPIDCENPLAWSPDGSYLYAVDETHTSILRWQVVQPTVSRLLQPPSPEETFEGVHTVALSPDAAFATTVTERGVRVWNLAESRAIALVPKNRDEWMGAAFASDGRALFTAGWNSWVLRHSFDGKNLSAPERQPLDNGYVLADRSADGATLALLSNAEGDPQFALLRHGTSLKIPYESPFAIALDRDASQVATSAFDRPGVQIRDGVDGRIQRTLPSSPAARLVFSPDGKQLLLSSERQLTEWDVHTGQLLHHLDLAEPVRTAAYRSKRDLIAVERSRDVALVRTRDWSVAALLPTPGPGRGSTSRSLTFSEDGKTLAVETSEGGLLVWQIDDLAHRLEALGMGWR